MNKCDLLKETEEEKNEDNSAVELQPDRAAIADLLKTTNATAPIYYTERSKIDLANILNLQAFSTEKVAEIKTNVVPGRGSHTDGISTVCLEQCQSVHLTDFIPYLGNLVWESEMTIFRIKGVVFVSGSEVKHIVQGVHDVFECVPTTESWVDEVRCSKIVFIGKGLNTEILEKGLVRCSNSE